MIERAFIHVGGPPGSGKTALIEAVLAPCDLIVLAARCRRDDSPAEPRESYPKAAPEFRRCRLAGAIGRALFEFPEGADTDAFFMTGLMSGYSHAVILEGDMPFDFQDLDVSVAPPPEESEELFVRTTHDVAAGRRDWIDALESVLMEPDGMARWTEDWSELPPAALPPECRMPMPSGFGIECWPAWRPPVRPRHRSRSRCGRSASAIEASSTPKSQWSISATRASASPPNAWSPSS